VPHLDLSRRYGYPARRILEAHVVERALLDAYGVDPMRFALGRSAA
jgi:hypothetical protein